MKKTLMIFMKAAKLRLNCRVEEEDKIISSESFRDFLHEKIFPSPPFLFSVQEFSSRFSCDEK
jgi:hypothetical protein